MLFSDIASHLSCFSNFICFGTRVSWFLDKNNSSNGLTSSAEPVTKASRISLALESSNFRPEQSSTRNSSSESTIQLQGA